MENNLIPPQNVPPFLKFCYTVGILPTSYKITWTYEEQVLECIRFIKEEVIPVVNANAMATTELQEKFIELVNYVETYLENLDVQEEINNKLDDMAESGELAEIIAQYLQLQGVLAYNVLSELKNAENIADGSICVVLGRTSIQDYNTNYYKIRTMTNEDIIDDDNIVALTNYPLLIAEKIKPNTRNNYVDVLPSIKSDNTEYTIKGQESEIDEIPESEYNYNVQNYNNLETYGQNFLKVGTFNIQNENNVYTKGLFGLDKYKTLRKVFDKMGCNISAVVECIESPQYKPLELLGTDWYKYYSMFPIWKGVRPLMDMGEGIISHMNFDSTEGAIYNSYFAPQHQGYTKNVYTVKDNKKLSFYSTHFCYNDNATVVNQIAELYDIVSSDTSDYIIVAGDFNYNTTNNASYLAEFFADGYKCANNGNYKTYDDSRNIGIDEIMVSSNIDIIETHTIEDINGASDHFPLYSLIELK